MEAHSSSFSSFAHFKKRRRSATFMQTLSRSGSVRKRRSARSATPTVSTSARSYCSRHSATSQSVTSEPARVPPPRGLRFASGGGWAHAHSGYTIKRHPRCAPLEASVPMTLSRGSACHSLGRASARRAPLTPLTFGCCACAWDVFCSQRVFARQQTFQVGSRLTRASDCATATSG